jgi:hypothetical protein
MWCSSSSTASSTVTVSLPLKHVDTRHERINEHHAGKMSNYDRRVWAVV